MKKLLAFTLGEVMIALAIVGIVGALTIPNMVKKYEIKETIARANKTISNLDMAITKMDVSRVINGKSTVSDRSMAVLNELKKNIKFATICGAIPSGAKSSNCFDGSSNGIYISGYDEINTQAGCATAILNDGTGIAICINPVLADSSDPNSFIFGSILIDANGPLKGPNQRLLDGFVVLINKDGNLIFPNAISVYSGLSYSNGEAYVLSHPEDLY